MLNLFNICYFILKSPDFIRNTKCTYHILKKTFDIWGLSTNSVIFNMDLNLLSGILKEFLHTQYTNILCYDVLTRRRIQDFVLILLNWPKLFDNAVPN